jgi:FkbM family methyltransferase
MLPLIVFRLTSKLRLSFSGYIFRIGHYLDVLTLKETLFDGQYPLPAKRNSTIIDIGANLGDYSILAARQLPHARILAYEPSLATYEMLCENLILNSAFNVTPYCQAVMASPGSIKLYQHSASGLSSVYKVRSNTTVQVTPVTNLEEIFLKNKLNSCDVVKMDCEGAEFDVLLNLPDAIYKKISAFALEYHDSFGAHRHPELVKKLAEKNYSVKVIPHPLEENIGIILANKIVI